MNETVLNVNATNKMGGLNIDLNGFAEKEHTHNFNLRYDVIYNGAADKPGSYELSNSVDKYKFLMVFGAGYRDDQGYVQKNGVLVNVADINYGPVTACSVVFVNGAFIALQFLSKNIFSLKEDGIKPIAGWQKVCIRQIIGIS